MTKIVVFEGPDASGKTVQTSAVARVLRLQGVDADWWGHPRPMPADARTPWSLALFYAAARARLAGELAAGRGREVLFVDRWYHSTTAALRGSLAPWDPSIVSLLSAEAEALPRPALTVVLTAPGELLDVRLARRGELRPHDATGVREAYGAMARGMEWPVVQTDRERAVVTTELVALARSCLGLPPGEHPAGRDALACAARSVPRVDGGAVTRPVIFLDIDGVLNSDASCRAAWPGHVTVDPAEAKVVAAATLDPVLVARVQRVCAAAGADIVIASGWRAWMSREEITAALRGAGLTAPVVDVLPRRFSADSRAYFAEAWLEALGRDVPGYVVIDDTEAHWPGWAARELVITRDGITDADADRAIAALRGEL